MGKRLTLQEDPREGVRVYLEQGGLSPQKVINSWQFFFHLLHECQISGWTWIDLLILTTARSLGCQNKEGFPFVFWAFLPPANHLCPEDLLRGKHQAPLTATHPHLWEGRCHKLILSRVDIFPSTSHDFLKQCYNVSCLELSVVTAVCEGSPVYTPGVSMWSRDRKTFSIKVASVSRFEDNGTAVVCNSRHYWSRWAKMCSNKTLF